MPADDYELWIRMGLALRTLGDVGRALWFEWSATSVKFDSSEAAKKWETFKPDRTGYAAVFAEAKRQGWGNSNPLQPYPHTDLGNAERLRARHGQSLRYCPQVEKWLYWDEERWLWDEDGHIVRCATESVRSIYPEAENIQDDDQRKKLMTHGLKSEAAPRIESMIKLTRSLEGIPLPVTSLDGDPMLVGVIGGTLDLAAGQFLPARRSNYITKRANVEYLPDAACPRWIEFLEEIFSGDQDLIAFIQRIVGYCLTGDTREQCLFVLHGHGANGKSVFLRVLHALLGDYAMETLPATLMETRRGRSATNDIARLRGSRMVSASEPDEGCTLAEGVVKQLTGQDKVTCRFLYAEFFEYQPQFKILLVTNHKPVIKSDGHAIWRRLHLVPFEVTISPERQDKELAAKLVKSELPGILNWALEGLRDWLERGLAPPEVVVDSTQEYRDEMDIIGDWLAECCTLSPQIGHTPTASLYDSYKKFCYVGNLHPLSNRAFGRKLADRGFKPAKGTKGTRGFRGIGLQGVQQSPAENLLQTRLGNKYAQDLEPQVPETAERR